MKPFRVLRGAKKPFRSLQALAKQGEHTIKRCFLAVCEAQCYQQFLQQGQKRLSGDALDDNSPGQTEVIYGV